MEQNWKSRNKHIHLWPTDYWQGCQVHSMMEKKKKKVSSIAGTNGFSQAKVWSGIPTHTRNKNESTVITMKQQHEYKQIKLLEENITVNLYDRIWQQILSYSNRSTRNKRKRKINWTSIFKTSVSKDIIKKVKR